MAASACSRANTIPRAILCLVEVRLLRRASNRRLASLPRRPLDSRSRSESSAESDEYTSAWPCWNSIQVFSFRSGPWQEIERSADLVHERHFARLAPRWRIRSRPFRLSPPRICLRRPTRRVTSPVPGNPFWRPRPRPRPILPPAPAPQRVALDPRALNLCNHQARHNQPPPHPSPDNHPPSNDGP